MSEKVNLKMANAGTLSFKFNAIVDKDTVFEGVVPVDGFSYELEIINEQTCGHGWSVTSLQIDPQNLEDLDVVAKFFLDIHHLLGKE